MWVRPPTPIVNGQRIGLLGGSFDPAHEGHLYVSDVAKKALKLDQVWWLVTPGNPLKPDPGSVELRTERALLVARRPWITVTGIETSLHARYTIDTVTALQRRFPHIHFIWLMGSDNLEQFSRWRRWRELAARIPIAVVRRPGSVLAPLYAPLVRLLGVSRRLGPAPSLVVLDGRRNLQSSTAIRALGDVDATMLNTLL